MMRRSAQLAVNKFIYRLGRYLYMRARGDDTSDMQSNGELMVQNAIVRSVVTMGGSGVFFDVGANIGDWTRALLKTCESQGLTSFNVHLFEPAPSTMVTLKSNLGTHGRLHYQAVALSSSSEPGVIYIHGDSVGTNSLHAGHHQLTDAPGAESVPILKMSAADYCAKNNIASIDLMKVDTEGHDMEVILGALPLLKQKRIGMLQFEYNHTWIFSRHYLKDVFDVVADLQYKVGKVQPDHIEIYSAWHPEHERFFHANYVLIREDLLTQLNCRGCRVDKYNTLATHGFL